jgi:hypothetical protein
MLVAISYAKGVNMLGYRYESESRRDIISRRRDRFQTIEALGGTTFALTLICAIIVGASVRLDCIIGSG